MTRDDFERIMAEEGLDCPAEILDDIWFHRRSNLNEEDWRKTARELMKPLSLRWPERRVRSCIEF